MKSIKSFDDVIESSGFDNHYKIAVCDNIHVPKFWHT